jgi:hypothetical protein
MMAEWKWICGSAGRRLSEKLEVRLVREEANPLYLIVTVIIIALIIGYWPAHPPLLN